MVLAAHGWPGLWLMAVDAHRRHPVGRLGKRLQQLPRPRHRRGHEAHTGQAARDRRGVAARGTCVRLGARGGVHGVVLLGRRLAACDAAVGVAAILVYTVGYTMLLKRRTSQNIVWGGAAGCMPVLIGWAAVTHSLSLDASGALPHHLLLDAAALLAARAEVPQGLRARRGADAAGRRDPVKVAMEMIVYAVAMVVVSLVLGAARRHDVDLCGPRAWVRRVVPRRLLRAVPPHDRRRRSSGRCACSATRSCICRSSSARCLPIRSGPTLSRCGTARARARARRLPGARDGRTRASGKHRLGVPQGPRPATAPSLRRGGSSLSPSRRPHASWPSSRRPSPPAPTAARPWPRHRPRARSWLGARLAPLRAG